MNDLSSADAAATPPRSTVAHSDSIDQREASRLSLADLSWRPPTVEEARALLPQYEIERCLGMTGMGAVYKGRHPAFHRPVNIKLLPIEASEDEEFANRFQREAQALSGLRHPGIVEIHDFGRTNEGQIYVVTDFVDGLELRRLVDETGLNPKLAWRVADEICEALHFAHSRGVTHGSLKPENILLTLDGRVQLDDFGLSRPAGEEEAICFSGLSSAFSAFEYCAPEQRDSRVDQRSDIFALGLVLYEMLTGRRLVGALDSSRPGQIDRRVAAVIRKALQDAPVNRYQSAEAMKRDLESLSASGDSAPQGHGFWRNPALGVVVAALAVVSGFALRHMAAHVGWGPPDVGLGAP